MRVSNHQSPTPLPPPPPPFLAYQNIHTYHAREVREVADGLVVESQYPGHARGQVPVVDRCVGVGVCVLGRMGWIVNKFVVNRCVCVCVLTSVGLDWREVKHARATRHCNTGWGRVDAHIDTGIPHTTTMRTHRGGRSRSGPPPPRRRAAAGHIRWMGEGVIV